MKNITSSILLFVFFSFFVLANAQEESVWTGTGFALEKGYVVTNHHVVDGAERIIVQGINGDRYKEYKAEIAALDKANDIAVIKVVDSKFTGFNSIPYKVKIDQAEVGESVFVVGYPLTQTMGEEKKLTNGIISSRSGFQGDLTLYQFSAPIQPGNSGGPLFDSKGNVIGIVCAHHRDAENVSYAIKTLCLNNLLESSIQDQVLPKVNRIASTSLPDIFKNVQNYVYKITCSALSFKTPQVTLSPESSEGPSSIIEGKYIRSLAGNTLTLNNVIRSKDFTILEFTSYRHRGIYSKCRLYANGVEYHLVSAEGIQTTDKYIDETDSEDCFKFRLYFPPLPSTITQFDFIESEPSKWRIFGIKM